MTICIPAKTFLIGEYAAMYEGPSLLLTTMPCFELSIAKDKQMMLNGIHLDSPAARWLKQNPVDLNFTFTDPYRGLGGLGASSAQFIAVYQASHQYRGLAWDRQTLLTDYYRHAWQGRGQKPSGHDVWAQLHYGCVYRTKVNTHCFAWPFADIDFVLLRTGHKLPTHQHLQSIDKPMMINELINLSLKAKQSFEDKDAYRLAQIINSYAAKLSQIGLCAQHTQRIINNLAHHPAVIAAKGCGAMGADIVLILIEKQQKVSLLHWLKNKPWPIIATSDNLSVDEASV